MFFWFHLLFLFLRRVPAHVLVLRHSSTSFWGMSIDPCLYHGKPGVSFNFTLYHLILLASFKSTTFSTCSWEFVCCCLTGVVGSCISLSVLWYWPWSVFFLLLLLPLLFRCCIAGGNVLLSLCCVAGVGSFCPWFCGSCGAAAWLRWSAWLSGSSRLILLSHGRNAGLIRCAFRVFARMKFLQDNLSWLPEINRTFAISSGQFLMSHQLKLESQVNCC